MRVLCDLFCRVVDNYGDAGVCWRLARQLAREYDWEVRLWIDDPTPLAGLRPGIDPARDGQEIDGVVVRHWTQHFPALKPGQVVIEAFACELPPSFVAAMALQVRPPVWVNLEYLSAEDWVAGCHGLPSPHASHPLQKYFFFPGFAPGTGGLLRERNLKFGLQTPSSEQDLSVSLFCYENPALPRLLDCWSSGPDPLNCLVADGLARRQAELWLGEGLPVGSEATRGNLRICAVPFVSQDDYDARLATCHLNFVRGEDSFVRAQWAERPFVWQIYPQDADVHHAKLDAFLARYAAGLEQEVTKALTTFWHAWNGRGDVAAAWPAFRGVLPGLTLHAPAWAEAASQPGDLAQNLVRFSLDRL
jgi:uncharacterized repeat protein (TIGR03837 family)